MSGVLTDDARSGEMLSRAMIGWAKLVRCMYPDYCTMYARRVTNLIGDFVGLPRST